MPNKHYMINPDVSCRRTPEGATLLNPDTDDWVAINAVGHLIWQALARPITEAEIAAYLLATCRDAPAEQVAADVTVFLQTLQPKGFVGKVLDENSPPLDARPVEHHPPVKSVLASAQLEQASAQVYHGNSMVGTFRPGDLLTVEPVSIASIRPGDVVTYRGHSPDGEPTDVVHRVVAARPGGLVTRGDNNARADDGLVTQEVLLGRVTHLERGGRVRRVGGGRQGTLQAGARRAWRRARRLGWEALRMVGRRPYRRLREGSLVRRLWRPAIIRLHVETANGPLVKYLHRGRVVGWWWPESGRFSCRKPHDLVIARPDGR